MPYTNVPQSNLAPILSSQITKLRNNFYSRLESSLSTIENTFRNGCINDNQKEEVLNQLRAIRELSINITNRLNRVKNLTPPLRRSSQAIAVGVNILKSLPIPGLALTAGAAVTFSDTLTTIKELSTQFLITANSIDATLNRVGDLKNLLQEAANLQERVDIALEFCEACKNSNTLCPSECIYKIVVGTVEERNSCIRDLNQLLGKSIEQVSLPEDTNLNQENFSEEYRSPKGTLFTIKIIEVESEFTRAPRRQAIALDSRNRVKFESSKSFSSSVDILKKEVRFKIDNSQL